MLPLADGSALMSDGARTLRVDSSNVPVGSVAFGGQVAVDAAGSFYVARVANGILEARSFTPTFAPRWTASYPVSGTGGVLDMIVSSTGQLVLLIGTPDWWDGYTPQYMVRLGPDGQYIANDALPAGTMAIGLATTQYVSARSVEQGIEIATHSYGDPTSFRTMTIWSQPFWVTHMALAADGSFVLGGHLTGTVDFGDGPIAPYSHPEGVFDAFVAAFSPQLTTQFSRRLDTSVEGLATTGREIAVSHHTQTQLPYVNYTVYDPNGNVLRGSAEDAFVGHWGRPGAIALAGSGRVYLDVNTSLGGPADPRFPFLVTLAP